MRIQQISINDIRGFKVVSGNNKNWLKINRETSLDAGNEVGYKCFFATKIRWEDWIVRSGVPAEFSTEVYRIMVIITTGLTI